MAYGRQRPTALESLLQGLLPVLQASAQRRQLRLAERRTGQQDALEQQRYGDEQARYQEQLAFRNTQQEQQQRLGMVAPLIDAAKDRYGGVGMLPGLLEYGYKGTEIPPRPAISTPPFAGGKGAFPQLRIPALPGGIPGAAQRIGEMPRYEDIEYDRETSRRQGEQQFKAQQDREQEDERTRRALGIAGIRADAAATRAGLQAGTAQYKAYQQAWSSAYTAALREYPGDVAAEIADNAAQRAVGQTPQAGLPKLPQSNTLAGLAIRNRLATSAERRIDVTKSIAEMRDETTRRGQDLMDAFRQQLLSQGDARIALDAFGQDISAMRVRLDNDWKRYEAGAALSETEQQKVIGLRQRISSLENDIHTLQAQSDKGEIEPLVAAARLENMWKGLKDLLNEHDTLLKKQPRTAIPKVPATIPLTAPRLNRSGAPVIAPEGGRTAPVQVGVQRRGAGPPVLPNATGTPPLTNGTRGERFQAAPKKYKGYTRQQYIDAARKRGDSEAKLQAFLKKNFGR